MVNVAVLYRQSSKKQVRRKAEGEVDIPGQRLEVQRFIATKPDWRLDPSHEYEEKGVSAYKKRNEQRDILLQVFADAEAGRWRVLIVFKHDRLGRQGPEYIGALDRLAKAGVTVWSVADNRWLSLDDMEFVLRALEGFSANKSSKDTSDRVKPRLRQLARSGRWTGGHIPFGYDLKPKRNPETGEVVMRADRIVQELVSNEFANVIRQIFERYLRGDGTRQIAHWLNSLPDLRDCGKVWSQKAVLVTLRNAVYCGWIPYLHGDAGRKMGEEPILSPGEHDPIISKEMWDRVQELLGQRKTLEPRQQASTYLLTGLARCGECGSPLGGIMRKRERADGTTYRRPGYRCLGYLHKGSCSNKNMGAATVDNQFLMALETLAQPSGMRAYLEEIDRELMQRRTNAEEEKQRAQARLKELDAQFVMIRQDYRAGKLVVDDYNAFREEIEGERKVLEEEAYRPLPTGEARDFQLLAEAVKDIRATWPFLSPDERKSFALSITQAFGLRVLVYQGGRVELQPASVD